MQNKKRVTRRELEKMMAQSIQNANKRLKEWMPTEETTQEERVEFLKSVVPGWILLDIWL